MRDNRAEAPAPIQDIHCDKRRKSSSATNGSIDDCLEFRWHFIQYVSRTVHPHPKTVTAHRPENWDILKYGTVCFLCQLSIIYESTSTSLFVKMTEMGAVYAVVRQTCFVLCTVRFSHIWNKPTSVRVSIRYIPAKYSMSVACAVDNHIQAHSDAHQNGHTCVLTKATFQS